MGLSRIPEGGHVDRTQLLSIKSLLSAFCTLMMALLDYLAHEKSRGLNYGARVQLLGADATNV